MKIGELAQHTACTVDTIRYWEKAGLLPPPLRSGSNYRHYREVDVERLVFIRNCRTLDMSLEEIRSLLTLRDHPHDPCNEINALVDSHIDHISQRISELQTLENQLRAVRQRCHGQHDTEQCGILRELSHPAPKTLADGEHPQAE